MNDEQRNWLEANYFETPIDQLRSRLLAVDGGTGSHHVDRYLQADYAATSIATAVAERFQPEIVNRVQYRTSTRQAPTWENRHDQDLDDQRRSYRNYGWRAPIDLTQQQLDAFDTYLDRLDNLDKDT